MRPRTLAILAAVVAALAAFVLLWERDQPSTDERAARAKRVFRVEADEIVALDVEWGGASVRLEAASAASEPEAGSDGAAEWRVVSPVAARADRGLVDRLTGTLAGLEFTRRLEGGTRADLGLASPRGRVTWRARDGRSGSLEIGGAVPASTDVVVAADGAADPLLVANSVVADLDRAPGDWRAKELVAATREEIERVRLMPRDGAEVVLVRVGTAMAVEKPFADAADRDAADALLGGITGLRAERFLDAPLAPESEAALAAGPGRLEVAVAGRTSPLVVELGGATAEPGVSTLRVDGQAVEARAALAESLVRPAEAWRSRSWSSFEAWRAERLRIEEAAGRVELVRSGGDWLRDGAKLPYAEPSDLIYALTAARAERVASGAEAAAFPATGPELTAVLADGQGVEETLTLYAEREGLVPARVSGRDVVLLLPPAAVADLRTRLAAVRAAPPVEGTPAPAAAEAP